MRKLNALAAGLALAAVIAAPASAAVVQGINLNLSINEVDSGSFRQDLDLNTGELTGFGLINSFNNSGVPIPAGRELTYSYGGFVLNDGLSSLNRLIFDGGTITLYSDGTPNFDITNAATATDSEFATPFLTLEGVFFIDIVNTLNGGTLSANLQSGFTALNVTGGAAADNFDTNSISVLTSLAPPTQELVDVTGQTSVVNYFLNGSSTSVASSSFALSVVNTALLAGINPNDTSVDVLNFFKTNMGLTEIEATGSADFNVKVIPEPGSMALVGLSLLGLGLVRRRKVKSAE